MQNTENMKASPMETVRRILSRQIFIPLAALLLLVLFNLIMDPGFFRITLSTNSAGNHVLTGFLITVLDNGSELAILAIGMTIVTAAAGGQDISVGAGIAISGSVMLRVLCGSTTPWPQEMQAPVIIAFLAGCLTAMLCGAFNGTLMAYFKIPPMVATLILYTAGRSIAAWVNKNQLPIVNDKSFGYFGGIIPGIPVPTPIFIAAACMVIIALVLKFTTLGLYTQSVGINESSARLNGINPVLVNFLAFVILGLCVAVAGLIKVSRLNTINYSVIAKDIEMDAILAVALGGNALRGGKFNIAASVLGAYVIQMLTITLYKFNVRSDALPAYKAVVVILLVAYLDIQPFIVTLAGMFFARGMTTIVHTEPFNVANEQFVALKNTRIIGSMNRNGTYTDAYIEIGVVVALLIVAVFFCVLRWTKLGRRFYAVGGNRQSALMLGINVRRTKFYSHLLCGLLAGVGGFTTSCTSAPARRHTRRAWR